MTQGAFRAALVDPALPVPPGLTDPQGAPAGKRFAVYRNTFAVTLTEALEQAFPVVRALVGPEFFMAMAGVFLRAHPPKSPVLMLWGDDLPGFLDAFPPIAHLPWLGDVARLELALRQSFHAADAPALTAQALAAHPPEALSRCRFQLAPALRLVRTPHPVLAIWTAHQPAAISAPSACDILVLRPEFDPAPHALGPGAADFITALTRGETLDAAAAGAGPQHDLAATFGLLLAGGALTSLEETPA
jgi:hypothetical protein